MAKIGYEPRHWRQNLRIVGIFLRSEIMVKSRAILEGVGALRGLYLSHTSRSPSFDRIVELAAHVLDAEFAAIAIVDRQRLFYLAKRGIPTDWLELDDSFCAHPIRNQKPMLVTDAPADARFDKLSTVTGSLAIRSYLGVPIAGPGGSIIGALSVADRNQDHFSLEGIDLLSKLAATLTDLVRSYAQRQVMETERNSANRANRLFQQAERVAKIGSWQFSMDSRNLHWSEETYRIHGHPSNEPIDLESAIGYYVAEDRAKVESAFERALISGEPFEIEATIVTRSGQTKRVRSVGERNDINGVPESIVGVFHDISDAHHANLALRRAAQRDSLTSLYNRRAFEEHLKARIARHQAGLGKPSLLLIDLDGFKNLNDSFGHLFGDIVLKHISRMLVEVVPHDCIIARWGGDEFAIISGDNDEGESAEMLASTILAAIRNPISVAGQSVELGATCGMATIESGIGGRELVRRADLALYHGKHREPGTAHLYQASYEEESRSRLSAISKVRSALLESRVFAAYQPIVDLGTERRVGLEALMRIQGEDGQVIEAGQVQPALIDPALSRQIGARMLELVSAEMSGLANLDSALRFVSVNATEAELISRDFVDRFLFQLDREGVRPELVTLEVTETMLLVNDTNHVLDVLETLKAAGISIALDDFGTGFSSLSHLRDFPIDKVKIDRSFIAEIELKHESRLIIQALIAMAKNLNIKVIAEGIETINQREFLRAAGCDMGQGFLFGKAAPLRGMHFEDLPLRHRAE